MGARVVGLDGCRDGWIAAVVGGGQLVVEFRATARAALDACANAAVFVFDIPIGLSKDGRRKADAEARTFSKRPSSVFSPPPRAALAAGSYEEAKAIAKRERADGLSLNKQAYSLFDKIREVNEFVGDGRVYEAHPEVSFAAMNGGPLASGKKTWNGLMQRRALLAARGLVIPEAPGELGEAGERGAPDDIADAVACAWTAARIARGEARPLPDPPEGIKCGPPRGTAIWY